MTDRAYVPSESVAVALGAEAVAGALSMSGSEVVRNGSRGLLWAEPMVEIERDGHRTAYGPIGPNDTDALDARELGDVDDLLAGQRRVIFGNCGAYEPTSLDAYRGHGGFSTSDADPQSIIDEVKTAGLRGYGGAGFPAYRKWQTAADTPADQKYLVANADEGDSGTFADRLIMEGDPFLLIEGMKIAGRAIGATHGVIYLRSEYPVAAVVLAEALAVARAGGILGHDFDIDLFIGAGAYICGEATSLLESLEGKRGEVRVKPPPMAVRGLYGKPTVVNNVLTLCAVPWIMRHGGATYAELGIGPSTGTMPFQLGGNVKRGGLYELEFGVTLGELVEHWGGGTRSGRPVRAVQVGGPLGAYLTPRHFDVPMTYEALREIGADIGHGGVVVFDDSVDMAEQAR
ncbi:MAG: SLBB domain-containing protein, partial [Chloroflexota bacterium]|nr:SLBB domain-containing protein [Chloroflexota bacterium]